MKFQNDLPNFMQSTAYADFLTYHGWTTEVVNTESGPLFIHIKKIPFIGNMAKIPKAPMPIPFDHIKKLCQERKLQLCRIEPNVVLPENFDEHQALVEKFHRRGFQETWLDCELQTIRVDLQKSDQELLASFPRENTRRNVRTALKTLIAEESDDLVTFHKLQQDVAKRKHFYCPSLAELTALWQSLQKTNDVTIVLVRSKDGAAMAGVFLIFYGETAYYRYVGVTLEAEQVRAPSLAVWQAMLVAKNRGCRWFDFVSVNDERNFHKTFAGYSHFKAGFSSKRIRMLEPFAWYGSSLFGQFLRFLDQLQRLFGRFYDVL